MNKRKKGKEEVKQSQWLDQNEQKAIEQKKQQQSQAVDTKSDQKYVFRSLLRQNYFNERFKYKDMPDYMKRKDCQREVQNFNLFSTLLKKPETVSYCEQITSRKSAYLLKYMPYQCSLCSRFSSNILIAQCSADNSNSCNSSICLQCANEFYEFMAEQDQPIQECGFCGNSLILESEESKDFQLSFDQNTNQNLPQDSRFSNIEEVDAENETESDAQSAIREETYQKIQQTPGYRPINGQQSTKSQQCQNLDNLIIRDATDSEMQELKEQAIRAVSSLQD